MSSDEISRLKAEIKSLHYVNRRLEKENKKLQYKSVLYDRVSKRTIIIRNRLKFIISFSRFIGINFNVWGIFIQKMFELMIHGDCLNDSCIADVEHTKLHISLEAFGAPFESSYRQYKSLIERFEKHCIITKSGTDVQPQFSNYKLKTYKYFNLGMPTEYCVIEFFSKDLQDTLQVSLSPRQCMNICYLNGMMISMNNSGILSGFMGKNFWDYLESIIFKETYYNNSLKDIQDMAYPLGKCVTFDVKKYSLMQLYESVYPYLIKCMESGYRIVENHPHVIIEVNEDCLYTACKAPYPCFILKCGHKISFMAYYGIINNKQESSERMSCPMCRKDLLVDFYKTTPTNISVMIPNIEKYLTTDDLTFRYSSGTRFISGESLQML